MKVRGRVTSAVVRRGTGSEHSGVVLETPEGERWLLVRLEGNPFQDPETRRLVGHDVEAEGYLVGNELRFVRASPLDEP